MPKGRAHATRSAPERRTFEGVVYDSIGEMQYAERLELLLRTGEILWWHRQVPIRLLHRGGGIFYTRIDFLLQGKDMIVEAHEVKGHETRLAKKVFNSWARSGPHTLHVIDATKLTTRRIIVPCRT